MAALEGKATTTPISMQDLANRIANLEATAKKWEIVTLSSNDYGKTYPFDSKFSDYNWIVLVGSLNEYASGGDGIQEISRNYNSNYCNFSMRSQTKSWSKSGNNITGSGNNNRNSQITVLFYK